ncbi:serine/threonine-protein kinase [Methylocystis sp.]|uniref:serine/threonine-protein kinase n=1 Tax=Methylocystis sp. TaxID=1911079 RepID=UPI0025CF5C2F|nr:serine/threonine-protein kinase [Methylocystis sp.]
MPTTLKTPLAVETAFASYSLTEQLGEGGAGRVYGGTDESGTPIAVKVLTQTSTEKRRRFKNEIGFLARNTHGNIVTVTDHGFANNGKIQGPFYVMNRYTGSLRARMGTLSPEQAMRHYSQILDGVEAAHLQNVTHRDLKPENILIESNGNAAIADFGIASFTADQLVTLVETSPTQRLANFQYAAPEQRRAGQQISAAADIYALGLMLNEMFTGVVPHGTNYATIGSISNDFSFLDDIVTNMIRHNPTERPASIEEIKRLIRLRRDEHISLQRLSAISQTVIPAGEIDDPLAHTPPSIINVSWGDGRLELTLCQAVHQKWVDALHNMGSFTSVMGIPPTSFQFKGNTATVSVREHDAQLVIDYFKQWLPQATRVLKHNLEQEINI